MRRFALLAVLIVSPSLAAPVPKPAAKAATLDGVWEVAERHLNGDRDDPSSPVRWTITGEAVGIGMRDRAGFYRPVTGTTYRLVKPAGGPANAIDYVVTRTDRDEPASTYRGRWERAGDTLKICIPNSPERDRPAACRPAAGTDLYVFQRVTGE